MELRVRLYCRIILFSADFRPFQIRNGKIEPGQHDLAAGHARYLRQKFGHSRCTCAHTRCDDESGWWLRAPNLCHATQLPVSTIGEIYPSTYFMNIARGAFSKGLDFQALSGAFWPILLAIPVLMALSVGLLNKQAK